ncbi:MAG: rhomboid family intramembrane serine protease [Bacteroidota bacterium]
MKLHYNAPVILTFTILSCIVLILNQVLAGILTFFFSVGPSMNLFNILDYPRLFTHVIGHANWEHLIGNFTFILLLGPILEEKYSSRSLLKMIIFTALVTGILNVLLFGNGLMGASGIVFMMILLSSVVNFRQGYIPLTFILVVILFLGKEITNAFRPDNISQFAHILGGICGGIFGFYKGPKKKTLS